jgi:hypothetical protein
MELGTLISDTPVECSETCAACDNGCKVDVLLRPDDVVHDDRSPVQAEVLHKAFRGADILYTLRLDSGTEVLSLVPSHHNHAIGEKIGIRLDADHVIAFKKHEECDDPACEHASGQTGHTKSAPADPAMIPYLGPLDPFRRSNRRGRTWAACWPSAATWLPDRILDAYRRGIFPWGTVDGQPLWYSPDPRMVLFPDEFRLTRSLRKTLRAGTFEVRFDSDFPGVMAACASNAAPGQDGTWITPEMLTPTPPA